MEIAKRPLNANNVPVDRLPFTVVDIYSIEVSSLRIPLVIPRVSDQLHTPHLLRGK